MQKSSETTSRTVAYIFFTTSKVAQGVFVCMFKAYMHIQNIALYQGTVLPSNQEISKKKKKRAPLLFWFPNKFSENWIQG